MVERRKHRRYAMPRGTFVILRSELETLRNHKKMSIGEIAMVIYKSKTEMMGQVKDIGLGGIAFDADCERLSDEDHLELDLLMTEKGIYIHNIPYAPISLESGDCGGRRVESLRTNALKFEQLDADHQRQLKDLMAHRVGSTPNCAS